MYGAPASSRTRIVTSRSASAQRRTISSSPSSGPVCTTRTATRSGQLGEVAAARRRAGVAVALVLHALDGAQPVHAAPARPVGAAREPSDSTRSHRFSLTRPCSDTPTLGLARVARRVLAPLLHAQRPPAPAAAARPRRWQSAATRRRRNQGRSAGSRPGRSPASAPAPGSTADGPARRAAPVRRDAGPRAGRRPRPAGRRVLGGIEADVGDHDTALRPRGRIEQRQRRLPQGRAPPPARRWRRAPERRRARAVRSRLPFRRSGANRVSISRWTASALVPADAVVGMVLEQARARRLANRRGMLPADRLTARPPDRLTARPPGCTRAQRAVRPRARAGVGSGR